MFKYRILTPQELIELEKEFIEFLIINGISPEEWKSIQAANSAKTDELIAQFSDVVFESILKNVQFLEFRSTKSIQLFQCLPEKLVVVSMESKESTADFMNPTYIQNAATNPPIDLKVFTATKPYTTSRETELFGMVQTGCVITDDKLFKTLCLMLQ